MIDLDQIRRKLRPWIEREKPLLVWLFGSTVEGLPGPEPDLDIAVLFGRDVNYGKMVSDLGETLGEEKIDLMLLDGVEPIAKRSASEGELIYEEKEGQGDMFHSLACRQFMDQLKFRKARAELNEAFIEERQNGSR